MKVIPVGTAQPGAYTFASPYNGVAYRFTPYAPGEKLRPEAKASADVLQGSAPLTVAFSASRRSETPLDFRRRHNLH